MWIKDILRVFFILDNLQAQQATYVITIRCNSGSLHDGEAHHFGFLVEISLFIPSFFLEMLDFVRISLEMHISFLLTSTVMKK